MKRFPPGLPPPQRSRLLFWGKQPAGRLCPEEHYLRIRGLSDKRENRILRPHPAFCLRNRLPILPLREDQGGRFHFREFRDCRVSRRLEGSPPRKQGDE